MTVCSIIILSYNTQELLKQCLTSIFKHIHGIQFEVIIVDNNSHDGSVEMVKKNFPKVLLIENKENAGFAKGANVGAQKARGEYLLFLNSDTTMIDQGVRNMISYMEKYPGVAIVGGNLQNHEGGTSKSFGEFLTLPEVILMLFFDRGRKKDRKTVSPVEWVSGGYMLVRAAVFDKIGGFDEHFFMYLEDMELCYRVKKDGLNVVYYPDAKVKHVGQGSSNRSFAIVNIYRGLQYFYKKHRSLPEYLLLKFLLVDKAVSAILAGSLTGNRYLITTYKKALRVVV